MLIAWALLLFCSCQKMDNLALPGETNKPPESGTATVQNLGHLFSGSYVTWKIHPLDPENTPLFTHVPNQTNGYCMLMIDNGKVDGRTPINAFHFVVVDFQTFASKIVEIKTPSGQVVNSSVGKIVRYIFGMDKKFYVATEAAANGGGHLIQYNPDTQTATDLGQPFTAGGSPLDIYSLNTGTDGALYGGSFGGDGQVYTFRYDYNTFQVDATPLDNTSRYVTAVSGDSRYTYAVCGKNNWFLYAIDRQTGTRKMLKSNAGNTTPISLDSRTDAPYAQSVATHYKLSGLDILPLAEYERPTTNRVEYAPYNNADAGVPKVSWIDGESKVAYMLNNGQSGYINVNGLQTDFFPSAGPAAVYNNKIYVSCDKQGMLGAYTPGGSFEKIGSTSMQINSLAVPFSNSADAGKIFLGGYPKGMMMQYSPVQNWSLNLAGLNAGGAGSGFGNGISNPSRQCMFQSADASGINGSMSLLAMSYTKSGYLAGAGNNDRITSSSGRELSMGSFKNGTVRNLFLPEFSEYEFQSMCLTKDSNYTIISAIPHAGNVIKLYKYDPAANQVVASWNLPLWGDNANSICAYSNDLLVGVCSEFVYLFDMTSGSIVWKQSVGNSQRIFSLAVAPDHSVYINHMYLSAMNFRIVKYSFDVSDRSNIKATANNIAVFNDADNDEKNKPSGLMFSPVSSELIITGLPSLYKVSI